VTRASAGKLVEEAMKRESNRTKRLMRVVSSLVVVVVGMAAVGLLAACESGPPITGSSSVEDAGLATKVNARLNSGPKTMWGVYATTDGSVVLTAPMTKADMGATDEKAKAFVGDALKRVFAELPEVTRVHVMDKNREDVGVFKPN
jgi:hypothetical protein